MLAFLSDPVGEETGKSNPGDSSSRGKPFKCSLKRNKKVCRTCGSETSFAFEYCPRCGGPLEVAVIEVS